MAQNKRTRSASRYWAALVYFLDQRPVHFLLIATLAVATAFALHTARWHWAEVVDNSVLDAYFTIRGPNKEIRQQVPHIENIVVIDMNEYPAHLRRELLAPLLDKLSNAKVIAIDLAFKQWVKAKATRAEIAIMKKERERIERATKTLANTIKRVQGKVILGTWPDSDSPQRNWLTPPRELWDAARHQAHLEVITGPLDSSARYVRLFEKTPEKTPCLGLAIAAAASDELEQEFMDSHRSKVDDRRPMVIDYVGGREYFEGERFKDQRQIVGPGQARQIILGQNFFTYAEALDDQVCPPQTFAGKTVIIGASDSDMKATPFSSMPGMLVHANIAVTLLSEQGPPNILAPGLTALVALACSLLLVVPLLRWPLWVCFAVALVQIVLLVVLGALIFEMAHRVLPASVPMIAVFLTYNAIALYEYRRVRSTLGEIIGVPVIPQALPIFRRPRLGGHVEAATAFFCDLRGFSKFSEDTRPEVVMRLLNEYTSALVGVVIRHKGRPIDYQGDGVFVLFEQALAGGEYSVKAVQAALEFAGVFPALQQKWCDEGRPRLEIGIGIATGEMVIGIVGAEEHKKFGAVGDAVNVAAHLQGLSRRCGYTVLLTGETYHLVQNAVTATACGTHVLKERAVEVYGVESVTVEAIATAVQQSGLKRVWLNLRRRLVPARGR